MTTQAVELSSSTTNGDAVITREHAQKEFDALVELRRSMNRMGWEIGARTLRFYQQSLWTYLDFPDGDEGFNQALSKAFGKQQGIARLAMKRVEQMPLLLQSKLSNLSTETLNELMRLGDEANNPIWGEMAENLSEEDFLAEVHKALGKQDEESPEHRETLRTFKVGSLPDSLHKVAQDSLEGFRRITKALGLGESNEVAFEYLLRSAWESPHINEDGVVEDQLLTQERFLETLDSQTAKSMQKFTSKKPKRSPKPKHEAKRAKAKAERSTPKKGKAAGKTKPVAEPKPKAVKKPRKKKTPTEGAEE